MLDSIQIIIRQIIEIVISSTMTAHVCKISPLQELSSIFTRPGPIESDLRRTESTKKSYHLYAFILATNADNKIFPGIADLFCELDELTSDYINIITRKFNTKSRHSLDKYSIEIIKFSRFCGLSLDELPCILFFDNLEKPEIYISWQLKDQDALSVVKDFRKIIASIEIEYKNSVSINKNPLEIIKSLRDQRHKVHVVHDLRDETPIVIQGISAKNVF